MNYEFFFCIYVLLTKTNKCCWELNQIKHTNKQKKIENEQKIECIIINVRWDKKILIKGVAR